MSGLREIGWNDENILVLSIDVSWLLNVKT